MNCTDVTVILDDHAHARLTATERCTLDEHVSGCEPCAHAWRAQSALLALPLPATPADLIERALRGLDLRAARVPRRVRARVVVGTVLVAGAALAAVTAVRLLERSNDQRAPASSGLGDARESVPAQTPFPQISAPAAGANVADTVAVSVEDVQSEYAMVIRVPPDYPREALERKLDGDVTLAFAIDERGSVKNVRVVRSSNSVFETSAIAAASKWKYLPRVAAGKRVAVDGVQTVLRFSMNPPPTPPAGAKTGENATPAPTPQRAHPADYTTFDGSTAVVWQRAADDDLRGAELELDELRATYDLDERQSNQVWVFYGYIYTQYGDYGRAIDAYENAVTLNDAGWPGQWTSLASLYFARHQYDKALRTLLAYKQRSPRGIAPEATAMIERLRALGVTEETL